MHAAARPPSRSSAVAPSPWQSTPTRRRLGYVRKTFVVVVTHHTNSPPHTRDGRRAINAHPPDDGCRSVVGPSTADALINRTAVPIYPAIPSRDYRRTAAIIRDFPSISNARARSLSLTVPIS